MRHRGYQAIVEYDAEDRIFHGRVAGLRDVVTFAGESAAELEQAFRESVDDYLALCAERCETPDKPLD
jgi:predicted HicB family RNase H-like nuclease